MNLARIGQELSWTNTEISLKQIEEDYGFPLIVQSSLTTASDYHLPLNCVALLISKQPLLKVIAHVLDKNCYVIGPQLEIPSTYNATFNLCKDLERDNGIVKIYHSIKEIAESHANMVYLMEDMTVTLPNDDSSGRFTTTSLSYGDQLAVTTTSDLIVKKESNSSYQNVTFKSPQFLSVHCKRLGRSLKLPLSVKGLFASHMPRLDDCKDLAKPVSMDDIIQKANFPLTAVLQAITGHDGRTNGERSLHAGMRLRLLSLEEHLVTLAVDGTGTVREFTGDATFLLPEAITTSLTSESEVLARNDYVGKLGCIVEALHLEDNNSDLAKYYQSVRPHIPSNKKAVDRTRFNAVARLRNVQPAQYDLKKTITQTYLSSTRHRVCSPNSTCSSDASDTSMWGEFTPNADCSSSSQIYVNVTENGETGNHQQEEVNGIGESDVSSNSKEQPVQLVSFSTIDETPAKKLPSPTFELRLDDPNLETVPKELYANENTGAEVKAALSAVGQDKSTAGDAMSKLPKEQLPSDSMSARESIASDKEPSQSMISEKKPAEAVCETTIKSVDQNEDNGNNQDPESSKITEPGLISADERNKLRNPSYVASMRETNFSTDVQSLDLSSTTGSEMSPPSFSTSVSSPTSSKQDPNQVTLTSTSIDFSGAIPRLPTCPHCNQNQRLVLSQPPTATISCQGYNRVSHITTSKSVLSTAKELYVYPPPNWIPPDDVASLSVQEVSCSLRFIGVKESIVQFLRNERIDGSLLVLLSDGILKRDCGFNDLQVLKLKQFIQGWRPNLSGCRV